MRIDRTRTPAAKGRRMSRRDARRAKNSVRAFLFLAFHVEG